MYVSPLGQLVADQAHVNTQPGTCPLCPRGLRIGERIARLVDGRGWAHTWCAAAVVPDRRIR